MTHSKKEPTAAQTPNLAIIGISDTPKDANPMIVVKEVKKLGMRNLLKR
jgi:hypothetical protein